MYVTDDQVAARFPQAQSGDRVQVDEQARGTGNFENDYSCFLG